MRNKKPYFLLDSLVVLLNIAGGRGNFLLFKLLHTPKTMVVIAFVLFIDIVYLFIRPGKISRVVSGSKNMIPLYMIIALLFINPLYASSSFLMGLEFLLQSVLFTIILLKISSSVLRDSVDEQIHRLSNGYVLISLFSLIGVIVSFVLLLLFGGGNRVPIDADFLNSNASKGADYVWSYLSIIIYDPTEIRVPFFQDNGVLCGLFHEPHIFTLNLFPCLILLLGFANRPLIKILIVVSSILTVFFAGSATNIIVVGICLLVYFLLNFKKAFIKTSFLLALIVFFVVYYISIDNTLFEFVLDRMNSDNTSQQYSLALLEFAFTPKTLFGTGFLDTSVVEDLMYNSYSSSDVGLIPFVLYLVFLIGYIWNTGRLLLSKEKVAFTIGMASLYYILHSAKVGMTIMIQTLPILIVFLQVVTLIFYGRVKVFKRNS